VSTDAELLALVRALRSDPHAAAVAVEIANRSNELGREGSPKRFTYNKLWHLLAGLTDGSHESEV